MRDFLTTIKRAAILGCLAVSAACSSDSTAPTGILPDHGSLAKAAAKEADVTQAVTQVKVLGRKDQLDRSITASAMIGPDGGTITIPETGFKLWIPMGALSKNTKITVTADAGSGVAYHFEPHGLQFNTLVWFQQQTKFTAASSGAQLRGAYFKDPLQLNQEEQTAIVDELYQINLDPLGLIIFGIRHFSGYLVSCA